MQRFARTAFSRAFVAALAACVGLQACHGGGAALPSAAPTPTPTPIFSSSLATAPQSGSVQLPAGVAAAGMTIRNSIDSESVDGTGHFTVNAFSAGPQFAMVLNASGTPMLMGFLGSKQTQISAHTTAQALVYFAAGIFSLPNPLRQEVTDSIPDMPGFSDLENAISAAIAANPDAFAATNPAVANALTALLASIHVSAPAAQRRPSGILINPSNAQSGVTAVNDSPIGVHFMNELRRPSDAFIDRMYYVDDQGNQVSAPLADAYAKTAIAPATGVTTLTNTIISVFDGWYGNQTYPYTPTNSATQPLDLYPGSKSTRYRVTVVGPGRSAGALSGLSADRLADQQSVTIKFVLSDLALPMVTSLLIPYSSLEEVIPGAGGSDAFNDLVKTLLSNAPDIATKANAGDISGSLVAFWNALAGSDTARNAVLQFVMDQIEAKNGMASAEKAAQNAVKLLNAMKAVDAALTSFDSSVIGTAIYNSDMADVFDVDVTATDIVITPASASPANGQTQTFTVTVPSAGAGASLTYAYQNTAQYGHLGDGQSGHTDNFTSTSNTVTYTADSSGAGTDTITVQVTEVSGAVKTLLGQKTATATVSANPICNGNFSKGLDCWTTGGTTGMVYKGYPKFTATPDTRCENAYTSAGVMELAPGSEGYFAQKLTVPLTATKLQLVAWAADGYDLATIGVRMDDLSNQWTHYLDAPYVSLPSVTVPAGVVGLPPDGSTPPLPPQPCSGDVPKIFTYGIPSTAQGIAVELRLYGADGSPGQGNSTFFNVTNVTIY